MPRPPRSDVNLVKSDPSTVFYCTENFYVEFQQVLDFQFNLLYVGKLFYKMDEKRLTVQETVGQRFRSLQTLLVVSRVRVLSHTLPILG